MNDSNIVDSKIVELTLNNQSFESNAKTSISTIDKLKQSLKFENVGDELTKINTNSKTLAVGVKGLANAFGTVTTQAQVSIGEIAKIKIAGEAIDFVKGKLQSLYGEFKSFTFDQFDAGWQKYTDKTESVQTILSATGKTMEEVNEQLTKLNWFTDETSYSFTDMTNNIGKFTNNGVELDQAVTAMQGISTWAAKSGANVGEASRAMYNLAQAVSVGNVKLMDWKSIENANMATIEFKQTALETAEALGELTKVQEGLWKTKAGHEVSVTNFNENLKDEWFTSKVLLQSLNKYGEFTNILHDFMDGLDTDVTTSQVLKYIDEYAESGTLEDFTGAAEECGLTVDELKEALNTLSSEELAFGRQAFKAAQEAKTLGDALDATRDAVSTAWMNTFETLFGDYEHAKVLWTDMANSLWDVFAGPISNLNDKLSEAFDTTNTIDMDQWNKLSESGIVSKPYMQALRAVAEEHGVVINGMATDEEWLREAINQNVIQAGFLEDAFASMTGGADIDQDLLEQVKALKETDEAFNSLTESLKDYSQEDVEAVLFGDGKYNGNVELEKSLDSVLEKLGLTQDDGEKAVAVLQSMGLLAGDIGEQWDNYSDEELRALGMTDLQIEKFKELRENGEALGDALKEAGIDLTSGGNKWTATLYNIGNTFMGILDAISGAWESVFPETTADQIYGFLNKLYEGTSKIKNFVETSDELRSVLTGIASVAGIVWRVISAIGNTVIGVVKASGIVDFIGMIVVNVAKAVTWLQRMEASLNIFGRISNFIVWLANSIRSFVITIPSFITNLFGDVGAKFTALAGSFKGVFSSLNMYSRAIADRITKWFSAVKTLFSDGFSFKKVETAFKSLKRTVIDFIGNLPGFKKFTGAFKDFGSQVKKSLAGVGIDTDKVKAKFTGFFKNLKLDTTGVGKIVTDRFKSIKTAIGSVFGTTGKEGLSKAQETVTKFKTAFANAFASAPQLLSKVKGTVTGFFHGLEENGGLSFKNIGKLFTGIGDTISDFFKDSNIAEEFRNAFDSVFSNAKELFKGFGIDLEPILNIFGSAKDAVVSLATKGFDFLRPKLETAGKLFGSVFAKVKKNVGPIGKSFTKAFSKVPSLFGKMGDKVKGFFDRITTDGGLTLDNVLSTVNSIGSGIVDFFTSGSVWDDVKASFSNLWEDIKASFADQGLDLTPVENVFTTLGGVADGVFSTVGSVATSAWDSVTGLYNKLKESPTVQKNITNFQNAFKTFGAGIGEHLGKTKDKFKEWLDNVKNLGGFKFDNLGEIFQSFKDTVFSYFKDFDGFDAIKQAFTNLKDDVKAKLAEFGIDIDAWKEKINNFLAPIKEALDGIKWPTSLDNFPDFIDSISTSIGNLISGDTLPDALQNILGTSAEAAEIDGNISDTDEKVVSFKEKMANIFKSIGKLAKMIIKYAKPILTAVVVLKGVFTVLGLIKSIKGYLDSISKKNKGFGTLARGGGLFLMALAIATLVKAVQGLREIPMGELQKGVLVIGEIALILGLLAKSVAKSSGVDAVSLFGLAAVLAAIAGSLLIMSLIKDTKLKRVAGILTEVIGWTALLAAASGSMTSGNQAGIAMIGFALTIAAIGGSLALLTYVDEDKLENAKNAIVGVLQWATLLAGVTGIFKPAWSSLLAIGGVVAIAAGVIWALSEIPMDEGLIAKVGMFNDVLLKMSEAALAITAIGALGGPGTITAGLAALGEMEGIGLAVTTLLAVVNGIVESVSEKLGNKTDLNTLYDTYLKPMFDLLGKIAADIGSVIGKFIGGIAGAALEEAASYMPKIAEFLASFNETLSGAGDAENIKANTKKLGDLIKAVGKVQWAGLKTAVQNAISNKLTGKSSTENFAEALGGTIGAIKAWNEAMGGENGEGVDIAKLDKDDFDEFVQAVTDAGSAGFNEAITSFIGNVLSSGDDKTSVERFSEAATTLSQAIKDWNTAMEGITNITIPEGVDTLSEAIKDVSFDTLWTAIAGIFAPKDDKGNADPIGFFKSNTEKLADAFSYWKEETDKLGTDYMIDGEQLNKNIQTLKDAFDGVDDKGLFGGLWESIEKNFGADTATQITQFKDSAVELGKALGGFSDALGDDFDTETFASVTKSVQNLGKGISGISALSTTGLGDKFADANALFGAIVSGLSMLTGQSSDMHGFTLNTETLESVSSSADLLSQGITALADISLGEGDLNNEETRTAFVTAIGDVKTAIESLKTMDTSGVDKVKDATKTLSETDLSKLNADVSNAGEGIGSSLSEGISSDTTAVTAMGGLMDGITQNIRDEYILFEAQGTVIAGKIGTGIKNDTTVESNMRALIAGAASAVREQYAQFYDSGGFLASGLSGGISSVFSMLRVYAAAWALADAAVRAIKTRIKQGSPSKVTMESGKFFGEGFEIGILDKVKDVSTASSSLGDKAVSGLNKSVRAVKAMLASDIEGDPVIRPVLDLSEIQNGAGMIGDMLNITEPVDVVGNMNAISANSYYTRNQSNDIISAINNLGKTLGNNRPGDSYVINGVTYDDGSNVSSAVRSLVQAAKISRRMS